LAFDRQWKVVTVSLKTLLLMLSITSGLCAQFGPPAPATPAPGKPGAPIDLTRYWVAYVTEDWRWRMVTPLKGDAASIPTNTKSRKMLDQWDPSKDGPRVSNASPMRGTAPSWQGYSSAKWESGLPPVNPPVFFALGVASRLGARSRSLEVTTTQLRARYLRKKGVPYSDKTLLKEYNDVFSEPNADTWLMGMTVVEDPTYLAIPLVTTSHFKKIADASGWDPEPCSAR
jgi:hypothetical protein